MGRANLAIVIPFGLITEVIMGEQAVKGAKHRKRLALDSYVRSMMELAKPKGISGVEKAKTTEKSQQKTTVKYVAQILNYVII
jgi:hypothetical protein